MSKIPLDRMLYMRKLSIEQVEDFIRSLGRVAFLHTVFETFFLNNNNNNLST